MEISHLTQSLKEYIQEHQSLPTSVKLLVSNQDLTTSDTVQSLSKELWSEFAENTLEACGNDPSFEGYSCREKMLAFTYTMLEVLKNDEAVVRFYLNNAHGILVNRPFFMSFQQHLFEFADALILDGSQSGEIQGRPFISSYYKYLFALTVNYVVYFWINDNSQQKEQTDVAVDKVVNLLFDTIAPNALDSAVDLVQFLIKRKM